MTNKNAYIIPPPPEKRECSMGCPVNSLYVSKYKGCIFNICRTLIGCLKYCAECCFCYSGMLCLKTYLPHIKKALHPIILSKNQFKVYTAISAAGAVISNPDKIFFYTPIFKTKFRII